MRTERPSFVLKAERADKHFRDLKDAIDRYANRHPYTISSRVEGEKKRKTVHRLVFTESPDPCISLIIADLVYNLRSGLEHLAAALVPSAHRRSVGFPIFFQGVWEPPIQGENEQRLKERSQWRTYTSHMPAGAVTILKRLQPPDGAGDDPNVSNRLAIINRLSNKDRHTKLPVIAEAVKDMVGSCTMPDGTVLSNVGLRTVKDGAKIAFPNGAMNVNAHGTVIVTVRVAEPGLHIDPLLEFPRTFLFFADDIFVPLSEYLWQPK